VKQQTRWSKSFFREAFWFPIVFAYQSFWLTIETSKQALYPFILVATVLHFLFHPTTIWRPISWLATMFGVAFVKSLFAVVIERDIRMLLFSLYGVFYFFGLLPSVRLLWNVFSRLLITIASPEIIRYPYHVSDNLGNIRSRIW
jgi:hyaluronan synthase